MNLSPKTIVTNVLSTFKNAFESNSAKIHIGNPIVLGLAESNSSPVSIPEDKINCHTLISGTSAERDALLATILEQQISRGGAVLFLGDQNDSYLLDDIKRMAEESGRSADVLVVNPAKIEESNTYNFVLNGNSNDIADRLMKLMPEGDSEVGADFNKQLNGQALSVIIDALRRVNKPFSCLDLAALLTSYNQIENLEVEIQSQAPESNEAINLSIYIDQFRVVCVSDDDLAVNTIDSNKYGLSTSVIAGRIFTFGTGLFGQVFNSHSPEVILSKAISSNKIVYISIPSEKDLASTNLRDMVMGDIWSAVDSIHAMKFESKPKPAALIFFSRNDNGQSVLSNHYLSGIFEPARIANIGIVLIPSNDDSLSSVIGDKFSWTKINTKDNFCSVSFGGVEPIEIKSHLN